MPDTRTILIIDDTPEDRETVRRYLQQDRTAKYRFVEENRMEEALDTTLRVVPDCILLDYSLPDGTGIEFLDQLQEFGGTNCFPVIVLTGTGDELIAVQAIKAGAQDYLIKGRTSADTLRMAVQAAIYKAKAERRIDEQRYELDRLYREAQDSSRRKDEILRELQLAKESAERANQAKDQFLATLSHELRTPLTPVLSLVSSTLQEPDPPSDWRNLLEVIKRNIELEARLIDDLLDLTRVSRGKLQLDFQKVQLHRCLAETLEICRSDAEKKHIDITTDLQAKADLVRADPARLSQVLWNLLKNAVKFTPDGGKIIVRTTSSAPDVISVQITDNGAGIDSEHLPKIFNAFEQGARSAQKKGGLGLGLAISKALVDAHGGQLSASSMGHNHGATFTLTLQLLEASSTPYAATPAPEEAPHTTGSSSILIIEDHEDSAAALSRALRRRGYTVNTANSVESGAQMFEKMLPDLVICDIGLPDGTGLDLIERVLSHRPARAIALSGFGMEHDVRRSEEAGFLAHLTKPINFERLQAVIRETLQAEPHPVQQRTRADLEPSA
jgi:signal transduction histidine kinase